MENVIDNIKDGQGTASTTGFNLARKLADEHQQVYGNKCVVRRVLDYVDQFNDRDREHYSFDVIEIIS